MARRPSAVTPDLDSPAAPDRANAWQPRPLPTDRPQLRGFCLTPEEPHPKTKTKATRSSKVADLFSVPRTTVYEHLNDASISVRSLSDASSTDCAAGAELAGLRVCTDVGWARRG